MKAVGKAASIPVLFGVNEPILFGAPLVLNPVFMIPFILTPIVNVWLFKFFVEVIGMDSFMYLLPWTTPGPVGLVMGTGFAVSAFVLAVILLIIDFIIYYPFFKIYDKQKQEEELNVPAEGENKEMTVKETEEEEILRTPVPDKKQIKDKNVLVLCAGGGTSGLLANALTEGAEKIMFRLLLPRERTVHTMIF